MKLIVAGSRSIDSRIAFFHVLHKVNIFRHTIEGKSITELVTGACQTGPDQVPYLLNNYINSLNLREGTFAIESFSADWDTYGKMAGPIRNPKNG